MIAFAVVLVLALGGLAAAIISKGDCGQDDRHHPDRDREDDHGAEHDDRHDAGRPGQRHRRPERDPELERRAGARSDQHRREDDTGTTSTP